MTRHNLSGEANVSSLQTQSLDLALHHERYPDIDPATCLKNSATGKTIFLSGGSSGIGRETAIAFAQAGAKAIYMIARSEAGLNETEARISRANPQTQCAHGICDVTDGKQVSSAVMDCVNRFGGIDIAHANAGYLDKWGKIGESDPESWWRTWEVNLKGTYLVARYAIPHLITSARKHAATNKSGGHLILMSSVGAQLLTSGASDYQTSKHAINRLCEFIDIDHSEDGVKCFAIHPGGVATELARHMPAELYNRSSDQPDLAAGFIVWLCAGKADWAKGRYLSAQWDVGELTAMRDGILGGDLLVNRLRTTA
jgi:NAD(P)-dependent dehydrogenase (short-subunit alcohol dehydrogenase family)